MGGNEDLERRALAVLRQMVGPSAELRDGQLDAVDVLVGRRGRALVVQRTGWGKSAVYFIATRLLREEGAGPTLLISPLLALMRNQVEMAARAGVRAATINSSNEEDWDAVIEEIRTGAIDLLLVSPERLSNSTFRREVMPALSSSAGLLVVDEAHCISDWGHDFRPDYRRVARILELLPRQVPVLCTTATANDRVVDDIVDQLGEDLTVLRGPLDRQSLALDVVQLPNPAARLAWLRQVIPTLPGSGIVYCLTVRDTKTVAHWLRSHGIAAAVYTGESDDQDRLEVERAFAENALKVVVATSALGMGYDKPDVSFVIHYQSPGSPIAYYQQVGRAGRALDRSEGILLVGAEDTEIQDYFISTAFPPEHQALQVLGVLQESTEGLKVAQIMELVNVRETRLRAMLKILEVEGAVSQTAAGRWSRTARPWAYDRERIERVTAARRAEQAAMRDYITTSECLMEHLRRQLDDPAATRCGRCARCTGRSRAFTPAAPEVAAAQRFLQSRPLIIEPRKRWTRPRSGSIPPELQAEPGRALAVYGDGGWGSVLKAAKYGGQPLGEDLLLAAVDLLKQWSPSPAPGWVTVVPSSSGGALVRDAAIRLAGELGLPFVDAVVRARPGRPQKEMENSAQQLGNVYGAFEVRPDVPNEPVLLIDDIADSRWTLTVVAEQLRAAGAGPVLPFVFALAEGR